MAVIISLFQKNDPIDNHQSSHDAANKAGQQSGYQGILHKFKLEGLKQFIYPAKSGFL